MHIRAAFLSISFLATVVTYAQGEKVYSIDELKRDLTFFREKLSQNHPNLYLYNSKTVIDHSFDSLESSIKGPMTELEFYRHIAVISSIIKDGHSIILPSEAITTFHNSKSRFLPFKLRVFSNRLFVELVCTSNPEIKEGTEILSLNGIRASEIVATLINRQVRDGDNDTYPLWIIDNYFREYYSYNYGHPAEFRIEYKFNNGIFEATIPALPKDSINYYRKMRYPSISFSREPGDGIKFYYSLDSSYGYLVIKDFHKDILKKEYKQDFETEIDRAFTEINANQLKDLVLDLRNNQGGEIDYGVYLLSYIFQNEFKVVDRYFKVDNQTAEYVLKETKGEAMGVHKPKPQNFKGHLYVMTNGGSFSNSGIVATTLKQNDRATFIGIETGGNAKVLAGYVKDFSLPTTQIRVEIPTRQFLLSEKLPLTGHGTYPDYEITPDIGTILSGKDVTLEFALQLMMAQRKER